MNSSRVPTESDEIYNNKVPEENSKILSDTTSALGVNIPNCDGVTSSISLPISYLNRTPITANLTSSVDYLNPLLQTFNPLELPLLQLNGNSSASVGLGGIGADGIFAGFLPRRSRGEKRPIPEEQKDAKYYEKRKRNNEAAKKSRDARKIREDRIAFRAAFLERENSLLKAQLVTLQNEMQTLKQVINIKENSK